MCHKREKKMSSLGKFLMREPFWSRRRFHRNSSESLQVIVIVPSLLRHFTEQNYHLNLKNARKEHKCVHELKTVVTAKMRK